METPKLFSPAVAPLTVEQLVDKLSHKLRVLHGNDLSVMNMAHKMVIEMTLEETDREAHELAQEILNALVARAAANAKIVERDADLFSTPAAIAEGALRDLGVCTWSDCRSLTPKVLSLMEEGPPVPPKPAPLLSLDSGGLAIMRKAKSPPPPRQFFAKGNRPSEPTTLSEDRPLIRADRIYWL